MRQFISRMHSKVLKAQNKRASKKYKNNLRKAGNIVADNTEITTDSIFEGKNRICDGTVLKWVDVGYGSYFGTNCYFERTKIGRYCSIAKNVNIIAGRHPTKDFVSTHHAFFSLMVEDYFGYVHEKKYQELKFADEENKKAVVIGNDVWIGTNASIMEGVTIGDGAVIAANALVTKDVKPYEIVGGLPAKHMKWRFNEDEIAFLENFKWWDKPLNWIKEHANDFDSIENFMNKYR